IELPAKSQSLKVRGVTTTEEMLRAVIDELSTGKYDVFISAAAPADYSSLAPEKGKISTSERDRLYLQLAATPKIVTAVRQKFPELLIASFKAEYGLSKE